MIALHRLPAPLAHAPRDPAVGAGPAWVMLVRVGGTHLALPGHPLAHALEEAGLRDIEIGASAIAFTCPGCARLAVPMSAALSDWTRSAARRHAPRATVALSPSRAALVEQAAPAAAFAAAIAQGALAGEPSRPHWAGAYVYLFPAEGRHVFRHAATGTETSCTAEAAY